MVQTQFALALALPPAVALAAVIGLSAVVAIAAGIYLQGRGHG